MCDSGQILILTPFYKPNIGGAETFCEDLSKELSKKYVVHICTIKWTKPILWEGLPVFKAINLFFKLNSSFRKLKYKYEKVYAFGLVSCLVCLLNRVKFNSIILTLYDFRDHNALFAYMINKSQKVFVEGNNGKLNLVKKGIKEEKIIVFTHWADHSRFFYVKRPEGKLKVVFIGRPIWIKGKHIIQTCEKMTEGIDYEYIENVPYKDLPKYYQMADVCVVPCLYDDSYSRVVVEAASCGCVLITSNRGSLPEQVHDFGKAIVPTPENYRDILNKLKSTRHGVEKIQVQTATYALKHFSSKNAEVFF